MDTMRATRHHHRAAIAMIVGFLWLQAADPARASGLWMSAAGPVGVSNLLLDFAVGDFVGARHARYAVDAAPPAPPKAPVSCGTSDNCIFLTSAVSTANLGGLSGADRLCNALASAAGMPGRYVAWLSDSHTDAVARVTSNGPYVTRTGTVVASGLPDLVDGALRYPIRQDEHGNDVPLREVWTGTDPLGLRTSANCEDWTSGAEGAPYGRIGWNTAPDSKWTSAAIQFCDRNMSLYCVEQ